MAVPYVCVCVYVCVYVHVCVYVYVRERKERECVWIRERVREFHAPLYRGRGHLQSHVYVCMCVCV